ncbi:MAG: hypothetical protein ACPG4K_10320 [Haloferula sp.]
MSPLPERRKTPEELAALRESLGIPPTPGAPQQAEPETKKPAENKGVATDGLPPTGSDEAVEPVPEPPEEPISKTFLQGEEGEEIIRVEAESLPQVRTLRKSRSLPVDQPKRQSSRGTPGIIPERRHSDQELNQLRKAAQLSPPVGNLIPKSAHPVLLGALYGLGCIPVIAALLGAVGDRVPHSDLPFDWLMQLSQREDYPMLLFGVLCSGALVFLLSAGWLAWARPLSRHHAGFMTIVAVLVLVFGTLYFFPELHAA